MLRTDLANHRRATPPTPGKGNLMNRYVVTPDSNRKTFNPFSFTVPNGAGAGGLEEKPGVVGSR
ncbi:hypothetical protein LCGC14_1321460 [marine sediment metagenome]|uniref:Uncharacterized protein n=1 Tax=marine sediment metagenome TaxID=412755 RepID=A0A0F9L4V3_9ZZZZ